jgi:hypothetical protein
MRTVTLAEALRDPRLLGRSFGQASHFGWHCVAKVLSGEALEALELGFMLKWTGRTQLPAGPVKRIYALIGRRGGKTRFLSAVGCWRAALCADWRSQMAPGELAVVGLVAVDRDQTRVMMSYCDGLLRDSAVLAGEVTRHTASTIEFRSGGALTIMTNDYRTIRGRTVTALLGDEASLWQPGETASNDEELVAAVTPAMLTVADGGLVLLSSTTWHKRGLMYRRFTELHGRDDADELCLLAPSRAFNPSLDPADIDLELRKDPVRARAEFLSEWRTDETDFIPRDVIELATDWGVRERPPVPGVRYSCFGDVATGTGKDSIALGICHEANGVVVLDAVRHAAPPFSPEGFIANHAAWIRSYGIDVVWGDRTGEWCRGYFAKGGLKYYFAPKTRSEIYIAWLPMLLAGQGRLIDHEELRDQAAGLERRVMAGGREEVNHGKSASAHDDIVNVCAGAMVIAQRHAAARMITFVVPPDLSQAPVAMGAVRPPTQPRVAELPVAVRTKEAIAAAQADPGRYARPVLGAMRANDGLSGNAVSWGATYWGPVR